MGPAEKKLRTLFNREVKFEETQEPSQQSLKVQPQKPTTTKKPNNDDNEEEIM